MRKIYIILFLFLPLTMISQKVKFSQKGGFYENSFSLELSCPDGYQIRYTTDGNDPTAQSALYKSPLWLDERLYSKADIYKIQISPDSLMYIPDSIKHAIVIRAALFDDEDSCVSPTFTNTYLIRSLGIENHGMAAVSLCVNYDDLFDYNTGIFVRGANWDPKKPDHTGNYYQHGKGWERPANVEFYEPDDNSGINQTCGVRTHGNRVRRQPAKGMKIYARNEYSKKRFNHPFFGEDYIDSFKHLILKPFASFSPYSGVQDYVSQKLALQVGITSSECRPVMMFLNGEYWGIYFIQEKPDERFLEDHFGISPDNCNIIGDWKGGVDHGSDTSFKDMMKWFADADLTKRRQYKQACKLIDTNSFIDYYVFQTFVANFDWPGNNMRCWQAGDGKWQWIFFDGDATIIAGQHDVFNKAAVYEEPKTWLNYPEAKLVFGKMLENREFKKAFKARAVEWCNGPLRYENTYPIYSEILEALRPHIEDQSHRFGYPRSYKKWEDGNKTINQFLSNRAENYLKLIDESPLFYCPSRTWLWMTVGFGSALVVALIVIFIRKSKNKHK